MPEVSPRNHWKDWVDNASARKSRSGPPFDIGVRITEPALLSVKATRFPGEELRWDGANHRFTNHDKASKEILSRTYRPGFEPPKTANSPLHMVKRRVREGTRRDMPAFERSGNRLNR